MLARDIEMFIEHCGLKGLSTKTINSYEQTLRLFMQYMDEQGILLTEKITHLAMLYDEGYKNLVVESEINAKNRMEFHVKVRADEVTMAKLNERYQTLIS